jgi:rubrerythrin
MMGLLNRLFGNPSTPAVLASGSVADRIDAAVTPEPDASFDPVDFSVPGRVDVTVYDKGDETLYVVGESYRQDTLWRLVGGWRSEPVREDVIALLVPEPDNEYDRNAVKVLIGGQLVGYLSREDAAAYLPGLLALIAKTDNGLVGLEGVIVGGGPRRDGIGQLGVFLNHDPADFGINEGAPAAYATLADVPPGFGFRTGFSEARATDLEDDSYDLSWIDGLSGNVATAIQQLRTLLGTVDDPVDRHYMLAELEERLYGCRAAFASALEEYDDACRQHDAAMDEIRAALLMKFGRLPILDTYRQAAVRCQKAGDWPGVQRWAERGLSVYGDDAAKPEVVEDLRKRLARAIDKIETGSRPKSLRRRRTVVAHEPMLETLICQVCGTSFERVRTQGRKPHACPDCRGGQDQGTTET